VGDYVMLLVVVDMHSSLLAWMHTNDKK
jgi:hypothetical protein